jgi:hypothetical protein
VQGLQIPQESFCSLWVSLRVLDWLLLRSAYATRGLLSADEFHTHHCHCYLERFTISKGSIFSQSAVAVDISAGDHQIRAKELILANLRDGKVHQIKCRLCFRKFGEAIWKARLAAAMQCNPSTASAVRSIRSTLESPFTSANISNCMM